LIFVAGSPLYFPNLSFRLIRANLPPHQACFIVPPHLNKFDIKNYLESCYQIKVADVKTMIRLGTMERDPQTGKQRKTADYKKAIVTMEEDFYWPPLPTYEEHGALSKNHPPPDADKS
jgi:large subunit ribosomal protein L23